MTDLQHLPDAWQPVLVQLRSALGEDAQLIPAGSWANGTADQASDLDLVVSGCAAEAPARMLQSFDPVHWARVGDGRTIATVLGGWHRLDVTFADDGVDVPAPDYLPLQVEAREFVRVCGLLPVVAFRQDWVVAMQGAMLLREMLIARMKAAFGAPIGGALSLKKQISAADYARLEALPALQASRGPVLAFHHAVIADWAPRMRAAMAAEGVEWPADFATTTENHLAEKLGGDWRFDAADGGR